RMTGAQSTARSRPGKRSHPPPGATRRTTMTKHMIATREKWLEARRDLLAAEKDLTRRSDEVARLRRQLPAVRIDKGYVFDGPGGTVTLADLFDGRRQL